MAAQKQILEGIRILDLTQGLSGMLRRLPHAVHDWVFGWALAVLVAVCFAFGVGVRAEEPIKPIPEEIEVNAEKLRLGRTLFSDPIVRPRKRGFCGTPDRRAGQGS